MFTKPFLDALYIIEKIEAKGFKAYFVGGCVRDLLLEHDMKDIDIATSATPNQIQNIFDKVIPVGIEHGTVIVRHQKKSYEVTTFRLDGSYSDGRHPDSVQFIDRIDEDLARRDFTMNALAMDKYGNLVDLYGGKEDLKKKLIRSVGDGMERFTEDPLRIIRAIRFASQLGFSIEEKTLLAMGDLKNEIEHLAVERIQHEMGKFFAGKYVDIGFSYLTSLCLHRHLPLFKENPYIIDKFPRPIESFLSFGEVIAVCHLLEPKLTVQEWVKQWKCSNKIKTEAITLVDIFNHYKKQGLDEWLVYQLDPIYDEGFLRIVHYLDKNHEINKYEIKCLRNSLPITSKKDLILNGHDIIKIFPQEKKGPWIQKLINKIEKEIVEKRLKNNKNDIKEWIKCNPPEIN